MWLDGIFVVPMRFGDACRLCLWCLDSYARMPYCRPSRSSRGSEALRAVTNMKLVASFHLLVPHPMTTQRQMLTVSILSSTTVLACDSHGTVISIGKVSLR
jgi:hypothetical protein